MSTDKQTLPAEFDDIRPHLDHEVREVLAGLRQDPEFIPFLNQILADVPQDRQEEVMSNIHSIRDFKAMVVYHVMNKLAAKTTFSVTSSGKSGLDQSHKHTFISNHRDIILDSAFLNVICYEAFEGLPRIAIGDNLLIRPWIRSVVRLCDAFIVKRSPSVREMLKESLTLSKYIRRSITNDEESVWIAQREGRAKDSDDRTQPALLKMLAMSGGTDVPSALEELHIVPLAISYEYDPCDYLKAKEMLQKRLNPDYKKTQMDDFVNMQQGLAGEKGRVHYCFGKELKGLANIVEGCDGKQEQFVRIAEAIDREIHRNYRLYPGNYVAYDLLYGGEKFREMYSDKERTKFESYLQGQLDKIDMEHKDIDFLTQRILEMYANPLINQLKAKGELR